MNFIWLTTAVLLTIVLTAAMFWFGRARWWRASETLVDAVPSGACDRSARTALMAVGALTLMLYLATGMPYVVLFHAEGEVGQQQIRDNILVLQKYLDQHYGADVNRKTSEYARLEFQLAEYLIANEDYLQASEHLARLNALWPEEDDFVQHYLLALAFASFQAYQDGDSEQAQTLRARTRELVGQYPHMRQVIRDVFARYLASANQLRSDQQPTNQVKQILIQVNYPEQIVIDPQAVLFVSAHDMQSDAPNMPIAARKYSRQPFPDRVSLSNGDALTADISLGDYAELVIKVRIAQSGTVTTQANDLTGHTTIKLVTADKLWSVDLTAGQAQSE